MQKSGVLLRSTHIKNNSAVSFIIASLKNTVCTTTCMPDEPSGLQESVGRGTTVSCGIWNRQVWYYLFKDGKW